MTSFFFYFTLLVGFGLQSVFLFSTNSPFLSIIPILLGLFWIISQRTRWKWIYHLVFIIGIAFVVVAGFFLFSSLISIISAVFILSAWDLTNYQSILNRVPPTKKSAEVEQTHLVNLAVFIVISLITSLGGAVIKIHVSFIQAVILLLLSFIGLMQLTRWLVEHHELS